MPAAWLVRILCIAAGVVEVHRVALVEDNEDNRILLFALLDGEYELIEFEDGPSALEGLPSAGADVVLLDISLPGMDGTEVLRRLRADAQTSDLPIVALTAHAMAGDRERFEAMGFDAYLTKPIVEEDELFGVITRLCESGRSP